MFNTLFKAFTWMRRLMITAIIGNLLIFGLGGLALYKVGEKHLAPDTFDVVTSVALIVIGVLVGLQVLGFIVFHLFSKQMGNTATSLFDQLREKNPTGDRPEDNPASADGE